MMIVVAGASGNVGAATVRKLSELGGVSVRALTRDSTSEKVAALKALPNVEIVECDLLDKGSVASACSGVKAAVLTCGNNQQQVESEKNFIDGAKAAGCTNLVKLGTVGLYTAKDSKSEYARYHAEIEEHLETNAGDMKWTVLRPNWFMTNHLGDIFGTLPQGVIAYPVDPEAKVALVDPRDVGDLAAKLVVAADPSEHHGMKLDISGPEAVNTSQMAALYTESLGRPIQAVNCSMADWIAGAIKGGIPEWLAEAASNNFPIWGEGKLLFPSSPQVLAVAPPQRTMSAWVKEWAPRSPPAAA
jgi:uncharacterized protein YbjT (DUF2867 family)